MRVLLGPADALRAARADDAELPRRLLEAHLGADDLEAARKLAHELAGACGRLPDAKLAIAATNLATNLALVEPAAAEAIANAAFPLLAAQAREGTAELELRLRAGKELANRSVPERLRLHRLLHEPPGSEADRRAAVDTLRRLAGAAPVLTTLFATRVPQLGPELARLKAAPKTRRARRAASGGVPWAWIIITLVFLRLLVRVAER